VAAGVTALAVAAMFVAFRRGYISRAFLAAMAGFYILFGVIVLAFHLT
jgi:cation:H+ antiporter